MDYLLKLIILFAVSRSVFAVPALPTFGVTRAGATTTYKVLNDGTGTGVPLSPSSAGTGIKIIDGVFNSSGTGYQTNAKIGTEIPAVKVSNGVTAANLAAALVSAVPKLSALGLAISAGTAIYQIFSNNGVTVDSSGSFSQGVVDYNSHPTDWHNNCSQNNGAIYGSNYYFHKSGTSCAPDSYNLTCTPDIACLKPLAQATIPPPTPTTPAAVQTKLTNYSPTPDQFSQAIKELHDSLRGESDPVAGSPTVQAPSGSVTSAPEQTVNPDGTVQTKQDVTTFTQISGDTISATTNTTTTTTHVDGSTTTTVTNNAPPAPPEQPKTDCEKYPDNIGCSKFGNAPTPDVIPKIDVAMSINPVSLGAGTCPAPLSMALSRGTYSLSLQPLCDYATMIAPLFIAFCWLIAGYIVLGSVRE